MGAWTGLLNNRFQIDRSFEILFVKWQRNMFRLNRSLIWIAILIEIAAAFGGAAARFKTLGIVGYALQCVLLPLAINVVIYFVGAYSYRNFAISDTSKVAIPLLTMIAIFTNLVTVHFTFPMLLALFVIPIFASTIYADRVVVMRTFMVCCFGICVSLLLTFINHKDAMQDDYFANVFIAVAMVIYVLVSAMAAVENERAKVDLIKRNIRSAARLKKEASHDGLTGLYNRKTILDILTEYMVRAKKGKSLHIAVVDIDHFKMINDTYGHSNGDIVLKALAGMFRSMQGRNVIAGRYGGEEFVIIFYNMPYEQVYERVNELREQFAHCIFEELDKRKVTISAGIAAFEHDMDIVEFFDEADRAMYKAKHLGRNRVEGVC